MSNNPLGNINEDISFEYGEGATAYYGCGVVFKGEYLYFGGEGSANNRQVSTTKYRLFPFHKDDCLCGIIYTV